MPRYELRKTSDDSLTYVEGTLPVDLFETQAAGTYRARVMSDEEASDIVVPALTSGSIVETDPEVGDTLTVSGSNAPSGATFIWQVDTGSGFGAAGGTNTGATYDTTGQPEGDYRRGVSTGGQGPVYTAGVTVGAALTGLVQIAQDRDTDTATTHTITASATAGQTVVIVLNWSGNALTGVKIDPGGANDTNATQRTNLLSSSNGVAIFDVVWPATGSLTIQTTCSGSTNTMMFTVLNAGAKTHQTSVANSSGGANPEFHEESRTTTAGQSVVMAVTFNHDNDPSAYTNLTGLVGTRRVLASGRVGYVAKNDSVSGGTPQAYRMTWSTASFLASNGTVGVYG